MWIQIYQHQGTMLSFHYHEDLKLHTLKSEARMTVFLNTALKHYYQNCNKEHKTD